MKKFILILTGLTLLGSLFAQDRVTGKSFATSSEIIVKKSE